MRWFGTFLLVGVVLVVIPVTQALSQQSQAQNLFKAADKDGNGALSFDEFSKLHSLFTHPVHDIDQSSEISQTINLLETSSFLRAAARTTAGAGIGPSQPMSASPMEDPQNCYQVCPTRQGSKGEPFGGPFGPDPYYGFGQGDIH